MLFLDIRLSHRGTFKLVHVRKELTYLEWNVRLVESVNFSFLICAYYVVSGQRNCGALPSRPALCYAACQMWCLCQTSHIIFKPSRGTICKIKKKKLSRFFGKSYMSVHTFPRQRNLRRRVLNVLGFTQNLLDEFNFGSNQWNMTPHIHTSVSAAPLPLPPPHPKVTQSCTKTGILLSNQTRVWNFDNIKKKEINGQKILSEMWWPCV